MDAYVFIQTQLGLADAVMNGIVEEGIAARALAVTGPWDVIARIEDVDLRGLGDAVIDRIRSVPGIARTMTCGVVELKRRSALWTLNVPPPPKPFTSLIAPGTACLVFVRFAPGSGVEALAALAKKRSVKSAALITGEWDLLVQVEASSLERVAEAVLKDVHSIAGITDTMSCLVLRSTPVAAKRTGKSTKRRKR